MKKSIISGRIQAENRIFKGYIVTDDETGIILEVAEQGDIAIATDENIVEQTNYDDSYLMTAGDFNAHSHPEQSLYTDLVDKSWDLATWCRNTIYKYSPSLKPEYVYYACCRGFSRMLSYGVTSVMVSFYCHINKGNLYDLEVIRAAKDTGIRLYFGRMNYDMISEDAYEAKKASQKCYYETPEEAEAYFIELLEMTNISNVVVAPAIHSIHASTKEAIIKAINLGNRFNRDVQFHLSEDEGDVMLSQKWYGMRPIQFLESLLKEGAVESLEHLFLSDCIWIDEAERALIKKYNMKVVLNPRMNHRVKAGQANLPELLSYGIYPYLGTDGEASNDDLSVSGEKTFLKKQYPNMAESVIDELGSHPIRFSNGFVGELAAGHYCDIKVMSQNHIKAVFVGGKKVLEDGKHMHLDIQSDIEEPLKKIIANL